MYTHHIVTQTGTVSRFAQLFEKLSSQRVFVCPWCSVVHGAPGRRQFSGPICLLNEPPLTSHRICKSCGRLWLRDTNHLEAWAALRRGHLAMLRMKQVRYGA